MSDRNVTISLSPTVSEASDTTPLFVNMEAVDGSDPDMTIRDLYRIWMRAISGIAASTYKPHGCPIEFSADGSISIWLEFYCFPSAPDLDYDLSPTIGNVSEPVEIVDLSKEEDIIFGLVNYVDLDFYPSIISLEPLSGCYLKGSVPIPTPDITNNGPRLLVADGQDIFQVFRFTGKALCHKYQLNIALEKGDNRITGLSPKVTATWKGADGKIESVILDLDLPQCVQHALELCNGQVGDVICQYLNNDNPIMVYVSECDGSILGVERDDSEDWCK